MRVPRVVRLVLIVATAWAGALLVSGCRPAISMGSGIGRRQIAIRVDGQEIALATDVLTVREALTEGGVTIDDDDRVEPDLWVDLQDGMTVRVIRVQQETIVEREVLAYQEQTIKSEGVPVGETRLLQAGKNGQSEITYRLEFEDGVEMARSVLRRVGTAAVSVDQIWPHVVNPVDVGDRGVVRVAAPQDERCDGDPAGRGPHRSSSILSRRNLSRSNKYRRRAACVASPHRGHEPTGARNIVCDKQVTNLDPDPVKSY